MRTYIFSALAALTFGLLTVVAFAGFVLLKLASAAARRGPAI